MITLIETSYNGSSIKGDAVMLSKYGDIYNAIDNLYHPNPGLKEDGYPEIERCIDWLIANNIHAVDQDIINWMKCRIYDSEESDPDEVFHEVMYDDLYQASPKTHKMFDSAYKSVYEYADIPKGREISYAEKIVDFINEKFLRIRAGGKLNPEGSDSIYFRISSHGYDWHRNIDEFLWEVFGDPKKMPRRIVICHDAETNPPEIILFDGTPEELFEDFDSKKFESFRNSKKEFLKRTINDDRKSFRLNQVYYLDEIVPRSQYKKFE